MRRSWLALLAALMAGAFLVVGQLYLTIPFIPALARRHDLTAASASLPGTAFGLAYALGFLLFGALSDRIGRVRVILLGLLALAAATLLVAAADGFPALLAARAVQGLAAATFPPAALSLIAETLPPPRRPLGIAAMSFAFLGAAPGAQLAGAALVAAGLPAVMLGTGPLYLLVALALLLALRSGRPAAAAAAGVVTDGMAGGVRDGGVRRLLRAGPMIPACYLAATTVLLGFVTFQAGTQALSGALPVAPATLRLLALPPLLACFATAPLARRFGAAAVARAGLLLLAAGLAIAATGQAAPLAIGAVLVAAGVALAVPGLIGAVAAATPDGSRGLALSLYSFMLFLGASLAPPLAGVLAPAGIAILCLLPAALAFLAAIRLPGAARVVAA
ncbi:MFS transporter [Roseomonas sp. NAR14]|uniref:MFS transporter n=1 Tax=Roseomonas acroporae TaxID=2937791 RepID=A0A9X1Y873_9PROT|nr:MFS transporter [Roseomonas acroporae]MCK8785709.1 MFS transporter [Roseomonas acroporae]